MLLLSGGRSGCTPGAMAALSNLHREATLLVLSRYPLVVLAGSEEALARVCEMETEVLFVPASM